MKISCPECRGSIKLTVQEIQKPKCFITCPFCQKIIKLKNNLPAKDAQD